jgi:hypothetical protein
VRAKEKYDVMMLKGGEPVNDREVDGFDTRIIHRPTIRLARQVGGAYSWSVKLYQEIHETPDDVLHRLDAIDRRLRATYGDHGEDGQSETA